MKLSIFRLTRLSLLCVAALQLTAANAQGLPNVTVQAPNKVEEPAPPPAPATAKPTAKKPVAAAAKATPKQETAPVKQASPAENKPKVIMISLTDDAPTPTAPVATKPSEKVPTASGARTIQIELNTTPTIPPEIVGEYVGVLHVKSPAPQTAPVQGSIGANGVVMLNAPMGVTTVGQVTLAESNNIRLTLRTRAPDGARFANGKKETDEFEVAGSMTEGIFRGSYTAPTDSGEFILCPRAVANSRSECRPSALQSLGGALGGIVGTVGGILGAVGGSRP